jgi:hypothetical protein
MVVEIRMSEKSEKVIFLADCTQHRWGKKVADRFTVEKYDITFSDRSTGTVYLLSDLNSFFDGAKKFFPLLLLSLLLVIGLTNGILTFLVSRSLICTSKPQYIETIWDVGYRLNL